MSSHRSSFSGDMVSSSSDDEVGDNFHSNIQLPNVDFNDYMKQQSKSSSQSSLARAGRKLKQNKSVRFPDSYNSRNSMMSVMSTTTNNSTDSDYSLVQSNADPGLPSFRYDPTSVQSSRESSNEDDDTENRSPFQEANASTIEHFGSQYTDSSDDDLRSGPSQMSSKSNVSPKDETDITEQKKSLSSSGESLRSNEKPSTLKGILRKMSLSENAYNRSESNSNSDTFIGRVLNMGNQGLGGGGLTPGASHKEANDTEDEEKQVGSDPVNDPEAIELKRINYDALNSEAKKLISIHIPSSVKLDNSDNEGNSTGNQNQDTDKPESESSITDPNSQSFYAPNPDYFIRGESPDRENGILLDKNQDDEISPPKQVHAGVLSSLLKLYQNPNEEKSSASLFSGNAGESNIFADENEFYPSDSRIGSAGISEIKTGIAKTKQMASKLGRKKRFKSKPAAPATPNTDDDRNSNTEPEDLEDYEAEASHLPSFQNARPKGPKVASVPAPSKFSKKLKQQRRANEQRLRITVHIADILQRQRFIIRMCRALMLFGAPTHRLEEYLVMTSRVLEIDGQFIYFPGCMLISFGDVSTRTSEVHLVRSAQGVNLSKLDLTHKIYKEVVHDLEGVEESARKLEILLKDKNKYPPWLCVLFYGLGSASVCPFAFGGGWEDIPVVFGIGLCVGYLQFYVSSMSNLYSSVFEVSASIVVSFISRGIGSIRNGKYFCFSALAQGALALILPGYIILSGSLELQSRNLVAGSVRMFYAIIYSLFLGFGITLGAALFGWIGHDHNAEVECLTNHGVSDYYKILFVPLFSIMLGLINQAALHQLPVMTIISCTGYVGTYFAGLYFSSEFTACIGAFIVGVLGNLYSRIFKGMAVSAMLPAIFVQVPSGIASQSTLLSGVNSANKIVEHKSNTSTEHQASDGSSLSFGVRMVEVSIGISVGLFAAALIVYPFGKRRTGLFTL